MTTENRTAELKKLPIAPSKWKAREILQKVGISIVNANNIIYEYISTLENKTIEEAKKSRLICHTTWNEIWQNEIGEEFLNRIGYEIPPK